LLLQADIIGDRVAFRGCLRPNRRRQTVGALGAQAIPEVAPRGRSVREPGRLRLSITCFLDPLNLMIGTWVGLRYYLASQIYRAIEQSQNTVDMDPNFAAAAHPVLGENYMQIRQPKEALAELQMAAKLSGKQPTLSGAGRGR
jgi:hypothetical protein